MKQLHSILLALILSNSNFSQTPQSPLSTAEQRVLDVNQVEALILGRNNKHWDILGTGTPYYRVPKTQPAHAGFANSIWIAGLDDNNILHVAANTYRQNGADFWPGPLDTTNANAYAAGAFNKIWKVGCNDINQFVTAYNNGSVTANTYTVPPDMVNYPAKGTGNFMRNMAPFVDANNDGQYNVMNGDYPIIKGQQQILSIYNDKYAPHTETGGLPMGLEIHERSYAFNNPNLPDSMKAVNYSTFYHYTIYNRSNAFYHNVYLGGWSDIDLGGYTDDYIGSDSTKGFAYCYNANPTDVSVGGSIGYGNKPPVVSQALIHTDCTNDGIDNNNNGIIDEPNETFKLNKAVFYNNNIGNFNSSTTNPATAGHYYNYLKGLWKDNSPFKRIGNGYAPTNMTVSTTNFVFDGNPQTQTGWTESTAGNVAGDRRFIMSSGPFNFPPNSKMEWGYTIVFSRDTSVANTILSFTNVVQRDVKNVVQYEKQNNAPQCLPVVLPLSITKQINDFKVSVFPNPGKEKIHFIFNKNINQANLTLVNVLGQVVKTIEINNAYQLQLDVSDLQNGIYMVNIEQEGFVKALKWIKE